MDSTSKNTAHDSATSIIKEFDYNSLFDQNLAGIFKTTINGIIVNCNDAFARMLKYSSRNELINTNALALYFSRVDRDNFITNVQRRKRLLNYESLLKCKDGSPLYALENIFLHTDDATGEEFCDGILIDISDRKEAELQIKEVNLKYQALFDNPMNAFFLSDNKGNNLDANNSACQMFGYSREELISLNRKDILDVEDPKFVAAMLERRKSGMAGAEIYAIKKDGTRFPVSFISSFFINANGEERFSSLLTDITERKNNEEKLLLSERRFKSLVQNSTDLLGILDAEGNYIYVGPTTKSLLGFDPKDLIGKNAFSFIHSDDLQITTEALSSAVATKQIVKVPLFRFKDFFGEWHWIETTITNLLDDPAICGIVANSRDVTERILLEQKVALEKNIKQKQITEAVIAAQESERSGIGRELHDNVNQLLTAAKLYTDMAKTDQENKKSFLTSASTYMITAIEEIRKLSKTLITPLIKDVGLRDSIKTMIADIMLVNPIKISFHSELFNEESLNEKYKLNIFRIIQEQINNVLKHAKANSIDITFEEKKDNIIISICDDGVGFDVAKSKKGIGIDNIISRSAVYKGDVIINTAPGKGCSVIINFIKSDLIYN
jgi:PAS domain S-box-containing protein